MLSKRVAMRRMTLLFRVLKVPLYLPHHDVNARVVQHDTTHAPSVCAGQDPPYSTICQLTWNISCDSGLFCTRPRHGIVASVSTREVACQTLRKNAEDGDRVFLPPLCRSLALGGPLCQTLWQVVPRSHEPLGALKPKVRRRTLDVCCCSSTVMLALKVLRCCEGWQLVNSSVF